MLSKLFKKNKKEDDSSVEFDEVTPMPEENEEDRKLTDREIGIMDVRNEKRKFQNAHRKIIELERALLEKDKILHEANIVIIEQKLELLKYREDEIRKKEDQDNIKHKTFVRELKRRLNIQSDKWGFDPDTGKVIE